MEGINHRFDPGRPVLTDVSPSLNWGEPVAVVGAGKSTLALIAVGLLTPAAGRVGFGGGNLPELSQQALRGSISMVSQEVHCFRGSILDHVRITRPGASEAEAQSVLDAVEERRGEARGVDGCAAGRKGHTDR